ncbi:amidohydrolase family protein [Nocardia sp. NPDC050793]|uniref:amidohydrolase family protein n=1 Tax=Nocardia sp. NPDC050793 TaxID=3155159 RepID=UPI0033F1CA54
MPPCRPLCSRSGCGISTCSGHDRMDRNLRYVADSGGRCARTTKIVDSHCHLGLGNVPLTGEAPDRSFDRYVDRADSAGVILTVVMAPPGGRYRQGNRAVGELVSIYPTRFLGYVFVNPVTEAGKIAHVVAAARRWGACGIKVHWSDGAATDEIGAVARAHHMPVLYDPYGDTTTVESLARRHPDVGWIIPHLSSFADDWRAQTRMISLLTKLPNVFTDTSGVRYFDLLADAVRYAGPHKVLFGSDGPYLNPLVELTKIFALRLPPEDSRLVLSANVLRLTHRARKSAGIRRRR